MAPVALCGLDPDRIIMFFGAVGGGSAEFIVGSHGHLERRCSVHAGAVRLTERFLRSDPVAPAEFDAMMAHLHGLMGPALAQFDLAGRAAPALSGPLDDLAADAHLVTGSVERAQQRRNRLGGITTQACAVVEIAAQGSKKFNTDMHCHLTDTV